MEKTYDNFWDMYRDLKGKTETIEPVEVKEKPKKKKAKDEVQTD